MTTVMQRRLVSALAAALVTIGALVAGPVLGGTAVAGADTATVHEVSDQCGSGYYENSRGRCTPVPDGSTTGIPCADGTYSHAENRSGACSRHGGIARGSGSGSGNSAGDDPAVALGALGVGSAVIGVAALLPVLLGGLLFGS